MYRWMACLLGAGAFLVVACGCRRADSLRVWVASDMVHLTDRTEASNGGSIWDDGAAAVSLFAAANETVSFQLVLDARADERVSVAVGPLIGPDRLELPADSVRLFRMLPVTVERFPAWYIRTADGPVGPTRFYDALAPIPPPVALGRLVRAQQFDLPAGERLAVWVDVHVPRNARAGNYQASLAVDGRNVRIRGKLALKVYDVVLPDARAVVCLGGFSHKTIFRQFVRLRDSATGRSRPFVPVRLNTNDEHVRTGLIAIRKLMRLAHRHRVDLFDKDIHPLLKRDRDGRAQLHWGDFDSIVKPYLDGTAFDDRIGVAAWPAPVWGRWPDPDHYGGPNASGYRQTLPAVIAQTVRHFESLGAKEKLFFWPRTATSGTGAYDDHAALARPLRAAGAGVPILTELPANPPGKTQWKPPADFAALADMFAAAGNLTDLAKAPTRSRETPLPGVYLRPGAPPYLADCSVLASPADVRALAWLAMKYDCPGIFLPETMHWAGDPYRDQGSGQARLFYPGADGPIASVRLKWLRRGLQDSAYLWLLRQRRRSAVADAMGDLLVHYASLDAAGDNYLDPRLDGWVRDGEIWRAARKVLAEEVLAAVHPDQVTSEHTRTQQLAWDRLGRQAGSVRVERVRSRITVRPDGGYQATLKVDLFNELPVAAQCRLETESLPDRWRAAGGAVEIRLAPKGRAEVTLEAQGPSVPTRVGGKMNVGVKLSSDRRGEVRFRPDVPFVRARPTGKPLTIDGDLSDWPMRPGNTAGGFILLGRRGQWGADRAPADAGPLQPGAARRATAAFVLHDRDNLYLAFRCEEPQMQNIHARASNVIRYDQLLATGEDLVEVVFDPGRRAAGVEGLYHLIVKCNGVVMSERGVHTSPPLGRARHWAVNAQVAVRKTEKAWFVEMAIPLKDFGPGAAERLWGVNFIRFATAGNEASNWAGAARYYYHPENLGTMYFAPEGR